MNFRLPTLAEFLALFFGHPTVDSALADLRSAAARARNVITHNREMAQRAATRHDDLLAAAAKEQLTCDNHTEEAARAERVTDRLTELLA